MHVNAAQFEMRIGQHFVGEFGAAFDVDAELVPLLAGRRLGVRLAVDVGVEPQCDRSDEAHRGRDGGDGIEFRLALDVEHEDTRFEGEANLVIGLADAGKADLRRIPPACCTRYSSPPETTSKLHPASLSTLSSDRLPFAFTE